MQHEGDYSVSGVETCVRKINAGELSRKGPA